jgi:hypothetical protein
MPLGQPDGPAWQPGRLAAGPGPPAGGPGRAGATPWHWHSTAAGKRSRLDGLGCRGQTEAPRLGSSRNEARHPSHAHRDMKNNSGSGFICLIFWLFYEAACTASSCKMLDSIAHLLLLLQPNLLLQLLTRIQLIMLFLRLHKLSFLKF